MCFNYKVSLLTFLIGTVSSLILIKKGNAKYNTENIIFGIFLIFISSIQFMDFLFWIDLSNKMGINHITTLIGPLLNIGQPVILYLIKLMYFYDSVINDINIYDSGVFILNLFYFIFLIKAYLQFLSNEKLVTSTSHGILKWPWIKYSSTLFYMVLLVVNIFYLTNFKYSLYIFLITYFFLYLSYRFFSYNISELWCVFGAFIPIAIMILTV